MLLVAWNLCGLLWFLVEPVLEQLVGGFKFAHSVIWIFGRSLQIKMNIQFTQK